MSTIYARVAARCGNMLGLPLTAEAVEKIDMAIREEGRREAYARMEGPITGLSIGRNGWEPPTEIEMRRERL